MARPEHRPVRKAPDSDRTVGDSNRVRVPPVRGSTGKPALTGYEHDSVGRAKADFIRRIRGYHSARGRVSSETDIRFQSIVSRSTHQRIREARRRLKHEPFKESDVPRAVNCDFNRLHNCNCGAYVKVLK